MAKTIIIHDDYIEVLKDGHNIIEKTIYDFDLVLLANNLVKYIEGEYEKELAVSGE